MKPSVERDWTIVDGIREWYDCEGDYMRYHTAESKTRHHKGRRRSHFRRAYDRYVYEVLTNSIDALLTALAGQPLLPTPLKAYAYKHHYYKPPQQRPNRFAPLNFFETPKDD